MVILRFTGEGEVLYRQRRIGLHNYYFSLWKFATMLKDSPKTGYLTVKDDPRILPFGKFLRKTKINEIPQLLNVLNGDMSIVGPRPLVDQTFKLYPKELQPLIYQSKPGLTGIGSLVFRNEETILAESAKDPFRCYREDIMPYKGALEIWYGQNQSFWVDIKIIMLTAITIILPNNTLYKKIFRNIPDASKVVASSQPTLKSLGRA
jgi:lipopolysaccharide/colanic/teichoic acid biosynthesis glycosyltransferase